MNVTEPGDVGKGPALVIEDDMLVAWSIKETLESGGFSPVVVATTDTSAAAVMKGGGLSLVVCDLDLGTISMGGWDILRAWDPDGHIPTLIHSAMDPDWVNQVLRKQRSKAKFLAKPAQEEILLEESLRLARGGRGV